MSSFLAISMLPTYLPTYLLPQYTYLNDLIQSCEYGSLDMNEFVSFF